MQATACAWLPNGLYIGCGNGQLALLDTAAACNTQNQAKRSDQEDASGPSADDQEPSPAPSTAAYAVVGVLEWSGQAVQVEALAVNKDLVAVAGHCPIIR